MDPFDQKSISPALAILAARQELESQVGADRLAMALLELPKAIRKQQINVNDLRKALEAAKGELLNEEALLAAEISAATNPQTGKAMYSNDAARKAELVVRQRNSEVYQTALIAVQQISDQLMTAEADLNQLVNEFSAYRHVSDLQANRMRMLAG